MGALAEPPAPEARARPRAVHNAARLVPLAMSLTMALLYVDAFVLKGASVLIERVTTLPTRGFSPPFVLLRFYGLVLALPYLVISYMLVRASGAFGEAARLAHHKKTRVALLYERHFGYDGESQCTNQILWRFEWLIHAQATTLRGGSPCSNSLKSCFRSTPRV